VSLSTVATRGYLSGGGSTSLVSIRGYGVSGVVAELVGKPFRRGKTKIWTDEELANLPEVQIAETRHAEYESLVEKQDYTRDLLKNVGHAKALRSERSKLSEELRLLNRQLQTTKARLAKEQQDADLALKRYRLEEEEVYSLMEFVVDLFED